MRPTNPNLKNSSFPLSKSQSWGRGVGVSVAPDAYERGYDLTPPLLANSIFGRLKTFSKSFEGFQGELFQKFPLARPFASFRVPSHSVSNGFARRPQREEVESWEKQIL